jgi:hypothetical protein
MKKLLLKINLNVYVNYCLNSFYIDLKSSHNVKCRNSNIKQILN